MRGSRRGPAGVSQGSEGLQREQRQRRALGERPYFVIWGRCLTVRLSCGGTPAGEPESCQASGSGSSRAGATYQMDLQARRGLAVQVGPALRALEGAGRRHVQAMYKPCAHHREAMCAMLPCFHACVRARASAAGERELAI